MPWAETSVGFCSLVNRKRSQSHDWGDRILISIESISEWLRDISGFHTFRHSAASFINALTGNLKLARKLLGHATIDTTAEVYTHSSAEAGREAALAVELAIYGDSFPNLFPIENSSRAASINRYGRDVPEDSATKTKRDA